MEEWKRGRGEEERKKSVKDGIRKVNVERERKRRASVEEIGSERGGEGVREKRKRTFEVVLWFSSS